LNTSLTQQELNNVNIHHKKMVMVRGNSAGIKRQTLNKGKSLNKNFANMASEFALGDASTAAGETSIGHGQAQQASRSAGAYGRAKNLQKK
jgi:hypothetical protein